MDRVSPLLLGPANCVAACGLPWRRVRDHATELGVRRVRVGHALLVPAAEYMAAVLRDEAATPEGHAPADPAAALRERLGLRVVGGVR